MAKYSSTKQVQPDYCIQQLTKEDRKEIERYKPEFRSPDFTAYNALFLRQEMPMMQIKRGRTYHVDTKMRLRVAYKKNNAIFLKEMAVSLDDYYENMDACIDKLLSDQAPELYQKDDFTQPPAPIASDAVTS